MISFALFLVPLCAFATPLSHNLAVNTAAKRAEAATWAPASKEQGAFDLCSEPTYGSSDSKNLAPWSDCLVIRDFARNNKGSWILARTTKSENAADWSILHQSGNCVLLSKNEYSTSIGNKDVADLIDSVYSDSSADHSDVEEKGTFSSCNTKDIAVDFWLRDTKDL
ncbi:hypothetical protein F4677DRAFT_444437 [Hypoxylon crocopeplum]|nr:hypothetical protein F4677DRAFT_444437 [Hypoxylon crocopeplum]